MEVKIKDKDNLIEATIEVVDGVLVVSPKIEKEKLDITQFKDGDIIVCSWSQCSWICILKNEVDVVTQETFFLEDYCGMYTTKGNYELWTTPNYSDSATHIRYATAEEQQKLFDKLAEEGYEFDFEKKELVKLKWKPKVGETIFAPSFDSPKFITKQWLWGINASSTYHYDKGWVFKTKEECEQFCRKLNKAIEGVKP